MNENINEKTYKSMTFGGVTAVVTGIILMVVSTVLGILLIISGSKLINDKSKIMF